MKKLTAILLFMSIMLSIIGCGAETVNGTASAEEKLPVTILYDYVVTRSLCHSL